MVERQENGVFEPGLGLAVVQEAGSRTGFALEAGRDGVLLKLQGAALGSLLSIADVVSTVPGVRPPFELASGPRGLRHLRSHLREASLTVRTRGLIDASRRASRGECTLEEISPRGGTLRIGGMLGGVPFTARLSIRPGRGAAQGSDVRLDVGSVRVWGLSGTPWRALPRVLAGLLPPGTVVSADDDGIDLALLPAVLRPLVASLGFKVPLVRGIGLTAVEVDRESIGLRFGSASIGAPAREPPPAIRLPDDPEEELSDLFARGPESAPPPEVEDRILAAGLDCPRLWPELLARARAAGEERPESVPAHLVAVLVAMHLRILVPVADRAVLLRRLVTAVGYEGDAREAACAGRLIAVETESLPVAEAIEILEALRARGVVEPAVLAATALALDRSGRRDEASATRARALSMTTPAGLEAFVRSTTDALARAGLGEVAVRWIEDAADHAAAGRLGPEGASFSRRFRVMAACLRFVDGDRDAARTLVRAVLEDAPGDRSALDLLQSMASDDRSWAEVVSRLRTAAGRESGRMKALLLIEAGGLLTDRLGLRHQASDVFAEAVRADPDCDPGTGLLERTFLETGRPALALEVLRRRIAVAADGDERTRLVEGAFRAARAAGDSEAATAIAGEWLRLDPTGRTALESVRALFEETGDQEGLERIRLTLHDLNSGARGRDVQAPRVEGIPAVREPFSLEAAEAWLAAGDVESACRAVAERMAEGPDDPDTLRLYVRCLAAAGRTDAAIDACRRLADCADTDPAGRVDALLDLADLASLVDGGEDLAVSALAEAAMVAPDDPRILEAASRIDPAGVPGGGAA